MPTCLRHVEETLGLWLKAWCWELLSPRNASDGCISHRLGSGHEWPPCLRSTRPERSRGARALPGQHLWVVGSKWVTLQDTSCRGRGWGPGNGCFNGCFTLRGEADMESLGQEVDPFATRQISHCPLWLSLTHPALLWYRLGRGFVCTPFPDRSLNEETVRPEVETQGAETASLIQLTARLVQCWSSCRPVSPQD